MRFSNKSSPQSTRHAAFLYAVVFNSALSLCVITLLFLSFLIQPIHQAYAQTSETDAETAEENSSSSASRDEAELESDLVEMVTTDEVVSSDVEVESVAAPTQTTSENNGEESESSFVSISQSGGTASTAEDTQEVSVEAVPEEGFTDQVVDTPGASTTGTVPGANDDASTSTTSATSSSTAVTSSNPSAASTSSAAADEDGSDAAVNQSETDSSTVGPSDQDSVANSEVSESEAGASGTADDSVGGAVDEDETSSRTDMNTTSSTEDRVESITEMGTFVNDDNFYQFSRGACVAVGDGTFHCSQRTETAVDSTAAVYADIGASGNLEIFIRTRDGKVEQLTDNNRDDSAPHYDPESLRVVWQRMVDSRYQIISYDLRTQEETQLTFARTNSMEPKVSPDGIVWQFWDGDDWEIMYFDGTYTDQITDNTAQDVAPSIQDGYIVWSVLGEDEQVARVYTIETGETVSIVGHEGGRIANPRFVLVYDTQFDNGDVVTQGFDPETGLASPISAQPRPEPIDIPNADTTGETIALIQNKPPTKDDKERSVVTVGGGSGAGGQGATSTATTTSADTLNLQAAGTVASTTSTTSATESAAEDMLPDGEEVTEEEFVLDEYDLVIVDTGEEVVSTSTPEQVVTIPRAVVQEEIASSTQ